MLKAFKEFALKGNMLDMAVGIVIGAAFTTVVKSLVDNVIMPPLGYLTRGVDFSKIAITLKEAQGEGEEPVVIAIGQFLNDLLSFVIVAFVLFLIVKRFLVLFERRKQQEADPASSVEPPEDIKLLTEIRDALKAKNS